MEIIEECDNEDEFLIKLADQLLSLKDLLGGKDYSYMLIAPLELLASMEENLIREKAVECLRSLAQSQEKCNINFHNNFLKFYIKSFFLNIFFPND